MFDATKFGVPALSAIVTANLFLATLHKAFLSDTLTLLLAIAVVALSSADTVCNPAEKKRMAFKTSNRLLLLEETLRLQLSAAADLSTAYGAVQSAAIELKQILDDYADRGW